MQPVEVLLRSHILKAIESIQDDEKPSGQRMSSTGNCLRQTFLRITHPEEKERLTALALSEMEDGNIHEDDVVRWLLRAGYTVTGSGEAQEELSYWVSPSREVTGHPDGRINGMALFEEHGLEIKSMGYLRYVDTCKKGLKEAHYGYYLQAQQYMYATGLRKWVMVIKAKDSSATKRPLSKFPEFHPKYHVEVLDYDPEVAENAVKRQSVLAEALDTGKVPAREYRNANWQCRYCDVYALCNELEDKGI